MKIIFLGRDNPFNRKYFSELSKEHELLCCLFLEPNRFKLTYRLNFICKRIRKYGFIRVSDELCFHLYYRLFFRNATMKLIKTKREYFIDKLELECPTYNVENIHNIKWIEFIRNCSPDIIFCMCSSVILKPVLYNIPKLGTFVLHEGITPEYKGLHTILWALLKKDYKNIGYTLLKINDEIDGGKILIQENYKLNGNEDYRTWVWIGHNALIEGLDHIKKALKEVELNKDFKPVETVKRESCIYTWMTLTKFLNLRYKIDKQKIHVMPNLISNEA